MSPASDLVEKRRRQSTILARLMVEWFSALRVGYDRKHIGAVAEELLVASVIRINDDDRLPPLTPTDIAKRLNLPRSNVRRCLDVLIEEGVAAKSGAGYRGKIDWLAARVDAPYVHKIRDAIIVAADQLIMLEHS